MSLLLAALLYALGAVTGPVVHAHDLVTGDVATSDGAPSQGSEGEGELCCFICQALSALAVPGETNQAADTCKREGRLLPTAAGVASHENAPSQARDPPAL